MPYEQITIGAMLVRVPTDILTRVENLPPKKREAVKALVGRYLKACVNMGVPIDSLDRCWVEAIESVKIWGAEQDDGKEEYSARWAYSVYQSPVAGAD